MNQTRIILNRHIIRELEDLTFVYGELIEAPYFFSQLSELTDFCISFNTNSNEWDISKIDVFCIILAKCKPSGVEENDRVTVCVCENPRDIYAYLMSLARSTINITWYLKDTLSYIHPTASIHKSAQIANNVYIDSNVEIGANCSIGFEGFGFGRLNHVGYRMLHTGGVYIGKNSSINCNATVVSGTFNATSIGNNVLVDDHVHIAHNCVVGKNTTLTASATLSGSVTIGEASWLGPNSSIINNVRLGDKLFVGLGACVTKEFTQGTIAGNPAKKLGKK